MIHYTYRGKPIDMEMMRVQHGDNIALGNAHLNARGDIIGAGGVVIKTRDELMQERERERALPDIDPSEFEETRFETPNMDDRFLATPEQPPVAPPKRAPRRASTQETGE